MMLSLFVAACLFPTISLASEPTGNNVAEINGTKYETLKDAVKKAKEGDTITLLSDVTEDVKFNKNITVDGAGKYTISGLSTVQAGTLTNLTLKPNDNNASGSLLTIGSGTETSINLENVTVHYSVTKRSGGSAATVSGNKAAIKINNCRFINTPNNNGVTIDAPEWSFGLFINEQNTAGSITFTNNEFNGAFRTMLPNVSGNMYNEDGSITFMPQSNVALEQFFNQNKGNIQVDNHDTVLVEENLELGNITIDNSKNITFEIAEGSTLEITGTLDIQGKVTLNP